MKFRAGGAGMPVSEILIVRRKGSLNKAHQAQGDNQRMPHVWLKSGRPAKRPREKKAQSRTWLQKTLWMFLYRQHRQCFEFACLQAAKTLKILRTALRNPSVFIGFIFLLWRRSQEEGDNFTLNSDVNMSIIGQQAVILVLLCPPELAWISW